MSTAETLGTSSAFFGYEEVGGVPVVTLNSALSHAPLPEVERAGADLRRRIDDLEPRDLLVDATRLEYMGSALLALVVRLWKAVKERHGRTVVAVRSDAVREVIRIAHLSDHWLLVDGTDRGLQLLGVRRPDPAGAAAGRPAGSDLGANPVVAVIAVTGVVGAIVGALLLGVRSSLASPLLAIGLALGAGLVGAGAGAVLASRGGAGRRMAGGAAMLLCLGAIVAGIVLYPSG